MSCWQFGWCCCVGWCSGVWVCGGVEVVWCSACGAHVHIPSTSVHLRMLSSFVLGATWLSSGSHSAVRASTASQCLGPLGHETAEYASWHHSMPPRSLMSDDGGRGGCIVHQYYLWEKGVWISNFCSLLQSLLSHGLGRLGFQVALIGSSDFILTVTIC